MGSKAVLPKVVVFNEYFHEADSPRIHDAHIPSIRYMSLYPVLSNLFPSPELKLGPAPTGIITGIGLDALVRDKVLTDCLKT